MCEVAAWSELETQWKRRQIRFPALWAELLPDGLTSSLPHGGPRFNPLSGMESINLFYFYTSFLFNRTISWTTGFFFFFCKNSTSPFLEEQHWFISLNTFPHPFGLTHCDVNKKFSSCVFLPTPFPPKIEYMLVVVPEWALTPGKCSLTFIFSGDLHLIVSETQICHRLSLS